MPGSRRTATGGVQSLRDSAAGWVAEGEAQVSALQAIRKGVVNLDTFRSSLDPWAAAFAAGDVVQLGAGIYTRTAPVYVPTSKTLLGHGAVLTWGANPTGAENAALLSTGAGASVQGLTVDAAGSGAANSYGISPGNNSDFVGVVALNAVNTGWNLYLADQVRLTGCRATNNRVGYYLSDSRRVYLDGCYGNGNIREGVLVQPGIGREIHITGGEYSDNGDSGISVSSGTESGSIVGVTCNRNGHQGVEMQSTRGWTYGNITARYNEKNGILISHYAEHQGAASSDTHVLGPNICEYNGEAGMQIAGTSLVTVTGGSYCNNSQKAPGVHSGIQVVDNATSGVACYRVTIIGVLATDTQANKTQRHGIYLGGTGTVLRVWDCDVDGNLSDGLRDDTTCTSGATYTGQDHRGNTTQPPVVTPDVPARYTYAYNLARQPVLVRLTGDATSWRGAGIGGPGRSEVGHPATPTNLTFTDTKQDSSTTQQTTTLYLPAGGDYVLMPGEYIYLDYVGAKPTWQWQRVY